MKTWLYKILNIKSLSMKREDGTLVIKRIIKVYSLRVAVLEYYDGHRGTVRFWWKIGKWYIK